MIGPPARLRPAASIIAIGAVCILVELVLQAADLRLLGTPLWRNLAYQNGAFWPGLLHDWKPNFSLQPVTMFATYAFLHGGLGHLAGNMITLLALGKIAVQRVGQKGFLAIYTAASLGGGSMFGLLASGPQPMVGASGALFGLAGAWQYWDYAETRPARRRVWRLIRGAVALAMLNLVIWVLLEGLLAWQAHLGGYLAGWAMAAALAAARSRQPGDRGRRGVSHPRSRPSDQ